ncbi:eukaryotic translation initiation factor 2A [Venturia canescens]|uniref:eukaryotic translation initiation factor 2A n=1 Tax=Venturia canescens TaxID=32260 RepID=UPI001C9D18F0|nr:eukaryotic translation initiation factor 2A [Venturia canescens]XP_043276693.1 eukaryotic translation initiation factor 2A [Venturia canescens]XP_043276694.1 eukaryotic translation initiation factor 2A [Venturia canescens]
MAVNLPCLAVRGSNGLNIKNGPPAYTDVSAFTKDDGKSCKAMVFSPEGRYFSWISGPTIKIALCNTWQIVAVIQRPKVCGLQFTPQGTYLMTWEPFIISKENPQGSPQLCIWKTENGELVKSFVQKRQSDWEPQWSNDEKLCGMLVNSDILFYENADFERYVQKINVTKFGKFRIAPGNSPYHVLCYMPGKPGQPSFGKLFQYPKVEVSQAVASKSFFQADSVDIMWNDCGTSALVMTTMEVDKTGASYYGKQGLHFLSIKGDTAMVTLSEEGPIHALQWSPKGNEFCVVYGFMPSKTTLFNLKCEPVFEFGKKHRNSIYYNPSGNICLLGGFGNLSGDIELWDMAKKKIIASETASDTTLLYWSPDGEHFMTATTAPRLRIANGYKIWHYSGTLLHENLWEKTAELWEVLWQRFPKNTFAEKPISYKAVEGITPSQPQASKQVYRPPSAKAHTMTFNLHDLSDLPPKKAAKTPSKCAIKAKKKREAKKAKKELESVTEPNNDVATNGQEKPKNQTAAVDPDLTDDPEKNKVIKKIKSKLDQISKLKDKLSAGEQLEKNQLDKIKTEDSLTKQLKELIL